MGRLLNLALILGIIGASVMLYGLWYYGGELPDYRQLADYEPPIVTRVYAGNGRLIGEFAQEKRVYVPVDAVPERVIHAFLAAEDKNFYSHPGIDLRGIFRAIITNASNFGTSRRPVGASTITQQVAKNFLLTNELSIERKIREVILATRIERTFTKDHILELYLNEIFLGFRAYGVAAAALHYYNKALDELTIADAAYLAALPKAPNNYHPFRKPKAAIVRRDYVIERMLEDGYITKAEAEEAKNQPLGVTPRTNLKVPGADYFVEEVRRQLLERYGEDVLWGGGLVVRSTLDPRLQEIAARALRKGLVAYDRRHGWRGAIAEIELDKGWAKSLAGVPPPEGLKPWKMAVVHKVEKSGAKVGFADGSFGYVPLAEIKWARARQKEQRIGPAVKAAGDVLKPGQVVAVETIKAPIDINGVVGKPYPPGTFALRQVPDVQGALVAMDPHTGRVLAMTGGFSFDTSQFNRATQAQRQPGSAFKPFVYLAALENGFTPTSIVLDAPVVIKTALLGKWKPQNYSKKFYGPLPMRVGLEKSRNLMTIRLAQSVGIATIAEFGERFRISDNLPMELGMALGASETTLFRLTTAYAMLVNGGRRLAPTLIDRIQDRHGVTVYRHDTRPCNGCRDVAFNGGAMPEIPDLREQIVNPLSAYQVVSMLEGVVQRGTGWRVKAVGKPIGGKTGTTNDFFDAWFLGFTPNLVAGVYVGFDQPRTLGQSETGSRAAAPIFTQFMKEALEPVPSVPFRIPDGIRLVRINAMTGEPARAGDEKVIVEAFKAGSGPNKAGSRKGPGSIGRTGPGAGTGGRY